MSFVRKIEFVTVAAGVRENRGDIAELEGRVAALSAAAVEQGRKIRELEGRLQELTLTVHKLTSLSEEVDSPLVKITADDTEVPESTKATLRKIMSGNAVLDNGKEQTE